MPSSSCRRRRCCRSAQTRPFGHGSTRRSSRSRTRVAFIPIFFAAAAADLFGVDRRSCWSLRCLVGGLGTVGSDPPEVVRTGAMGAGPDGSPAGSGVPPAVSELLDGHDATAGTEQLEQEAPSGCTRRFGPAGNRRPGDRHPLRRYLVDARQRMHHDRSLAEMHPWLPRSMIGRCPWLPGIPRESRIAHAGFASDRPHRPPAVRRSRSGSSRKCTPASSSAASHVVTHWHRIGRDEEQLDAIASAETCRASDRAARPNRRSPTSATLRSSIVPSSSRMV